MKRIALALALAIPTAVLSADKPVFNVSPGFRLATDASDEKYSPDLPKESVEYKSARFTQNIFELVNGGGLPGYVPGSYSRIEPFPIAQMADKRWHQPGGMEGISRDLWEAKKFRTLPKDKPIQKWLGAIQVRNGIGEVKDKDGKVTREGGKQLARALLRRYPDGTQFDEILINKTTGLVFEHRRRVKQDGAWESEVVYRDPKQFPKGYTAKLPSCASCHDEAGEGRYSDGAVPGGDGVLSDPLPWEVWTRTPPEKAVGWQRLPTVEAAPACST